MIRIKHKLIIISLLLVALLVPIVPANAVVVSIDPDPMLISISPPDGFEGHPLKATCLTEDGNYWFVGGNIFQGNWMLQTDANGNVLQERIILGAPGEYPILKCLSQVGDTLMLCFIDGDTMIGTLGIMDNPWDEIEYQSLGELKIFDMQATPKGILVSGILYNDEADTYHLQVKLVGPQGEIRFQYNGTTYDMGPRFTGMISSLCAAAGDSYYVQECWDDINRALARVDAEGSEVWRVLLQDRVFPKGIAATDDGVYLVGDTYDLNVDGTAGNKRAFVQYYTNAGVLQWTHTFDEIERFSRVTANSDAVIVWTRNNPIWYFYVISLDGSLRDIVQVNTERNGSIVIRMYAMENGNIVAVGDDYYDLLLVEIPFALYK